MVFPIQCKGNENPLKFSHRKVKISVSRLIFLYFVPLLFLQASKTLFYSSKKQFLDNYLATSPPFSLTSLTTFHSFSADAMKTQSDSNIWLLKYKSDKFR